MKQNFLGRDIAIYSLNSNSFFYGFDFNALIINYLNFMKIEKFEDLIVWKDAMRLVVEVYEQMKECRDFGFKDQIQRSSVSIPSNIAEGYERQSNKEFIQYLYIAKGSCGELRTQLYLAINIRLMDKEKGMYGVIRENKENLLYALWTNSNKKRKILTEILR